MRVRLMRGRAVLFTTDPSAMLCARLRAAGFTSANEVIWTGTYDDLWRLNLDSALLPPGPACTWPHHWAPPRCECQKCEPFDGAPVPCEHQPSVTSSWQSSNGTR